MANKTLSPLRAHLTHSNASPISINPFPDTSCYPLPKIKVPNNSCYLKTFSMFPQLTLYWCWPGVSLSSNITKLSIYLFRLILLNPIFVVERHFINLDHVPMFCYKVKTPYAMLRYVAIVKYSVFLWKYGSTFSIPYHCLFSMGTFYWTTHTLTHTQ